MRRRATNTIFITLAVLLAQPLLAQEPEYDYRAYKFYKDDAYEPLWLEEIDPAHDEVRQLSFYYSIPTYMRASVVQRARGVAYDEHCYFAGGVEIDYTTSRLLSAMRYDRDDGMGLGGVADGGALAATTRYRLTEQRLYSSHHSIRGELSGREYLGGISYTTQLRLSRRGVALKDDPSLGVVARAYGGRDLYIEGVFGNRVEVGANAMFRPGVGVMDIAAFISWSERGLRQASTDEAFSLLGNVLYNPSWGMQHGRMRNARISRNLTPEVLASWRVPLGAFTELYATANIRYDADRLTSLTWFNASSPLPDNYRYMPSYYEDREVALEVERAWLNNDLRYTQIDWDALYHSNAIVDSGHAVYAVEGRHQNRIRSALACGLQSTYNRVVFDYGVRLDYIDERIFKRMDDLLGAQYVIDYDYFYVGDDTSTSGLQNNMREPDRRVEEGDKYGYDYRLFGWRATLFAESEWYLADNLLSAGVSLTSASVRRRGYFEKELFRGAASYGASRRVMFTPYVVHAAWMRSFDNHTLSARLLLRGDAPDIDALFLQPQYNNRIVDNPNLATTFSAQLGYRFVNPRVNIVAQAYLISSSRGSDVVRYYDDLAGCYCDAVVSNVGKLNYGIEAVLRVVYARRFSSVFMLRAGDARYATDANVRVYADRDNGLVANSVSHISGCRDASPAVSLYANLRYRSFDGWSATLAVQYHAMRYVDPSYVRRMERVVSFAVSPEEVSMLMTQQRLPDAVSFDIEVSKSFDFGDAGILRLQLAVRNVLGTKMIYSGYEQNRIRITDNGGYMATIPFDNKLRYAYPRTYSFTASYYF